MRLVIDTLKKVVYKYRHFITWLGLFVIIFFLYYPTLHGTFILDDYVWIEPLTLAQIGKLFVGSWEHGNTLRPIMRLLFLLNHTLFHDLSFGWHLTNVLLHTSVSWFVYFILQKSTKRNWIARISAVLFAIMPTHHEVVAWISGQTHAWGLLLSLIAGLLFYYSLQQNQRHLEIEIAGYVVMFLAFLTYEISFIIPLTMLVCLILFPQLKSKKIWRIVGISFLLLFLLIIYRYFVLGHSTGSVGAQQTNIFLAPFFNARAVLHLFFYTKTLTFFYCVLIFLLAVGLFIKTKGIRPYGKLSICCALLAVLAYLPFSVMNGVAPRFLYSTLFFFVLTIGFSLSNIQTSYKPYHFFLWLIVGNIITLSIVRTSQTASVYSALADSYERVRNQVTNDYPLWPRNRALLFYHIPNGVADGTQGVLAFLTYFDRAIRYGYPNQEAPQLIFRAERLSPDELNKILLHQPIVYDFVDLQHGVIKMSD